MKTVTTDSAAIATPTVAMSIAVRSCVSFVGSVMSIDAYSSPSDVIDCLSKLDLQPARLLAICIFLISRFLSTRAAESSVSALDTSAIRD